MKRNESMENREMIKIELSELLKTYYNDSFAQLVCDYIRHTGMTQQEVKELMEVIRKEKGA